MIMSYFRFRLAGFSQNSSSVQGKFGNASASFACYDARGYHCCESAFGGVMAFVLESGITDRFSPSVDRMVRCLHQISTPQYKVKEVIKGGSLGKGTATPESDIDLVVYFNGLNSIEHLKSARPELNQLIASHIGRHLQLSQLKQSSWFVKCTLDGIEMDIVPAFDVLAERGGAAAVYREMASYPGGVREAAQQYSASLATLQRDFVKYVDSRIKDAIRDLKTWAERNGVKIASYCLELIAIHVYQPPMSKEQLFRKCMQQLASCDNLRIAFNKNYNSGNYTSYMTVPYIMDPANPYMNVLERVDTGAVSRAASVWCRSN